MSRSITLAPRLALGIATAVALSLVGATASSAGAVGAASAVAKTTTVQTASSASSLASVATAERKGKGKKLVAKGEGGKMLSKVKGRASDKSKVRGTFTPMTFVKQGGGLAVEGVLQGVIKRKGKKNLTFDIIRTVPVESVNGVATQPSNGRAAKAAALPCDILHLNLAPLDLDLLGLQVHLDRVVLDIVAQSGGGNLLGNLLCAVTGLLDGFQILALLQQLIDLLNQILGQLGLGL